MNIESKRPVKKRRIILGGSAGLILLWGLIFLGGNLISARQRSGARARYISTPPDTGKEKDLTMKIDRLRKSIHKLSPKGIHIIIDSGRNVLYLKNGNTIMREAVVSCGSGNILENPDDQRHWVFDTPRGVFSVTSLMSNPAWVKPDWTFVEEGKPIPKDPRLRVETGMLGDYALGFGDGYFIHGTLYTRLLGRNVTHGCIRVGDDDLRSVFKAARIGTPIFIY